MSFHYISFSPTPPHERKRLASHWELQMVLLCTHHASLWSHILLLPFYFHFSFLFFISLLKLKMKKINKDERINRLCNNNPPPHWSIRNFWLGALPNQRQSFPAHLWAHPACNPLLSGKVPDVKKDKTLKMHPVSI